MDEAGRRRLDAEVAGCASSHQSLLAHLDELLAAGATTGREPSQLPGWSIGHVLSHLARNADGTRAMAEGAAVGEHWRKYESAESRSGDIDAGAGRPFGELVDDVRRSAWKLEQSWAALDENGWAGFGMSLGGPEPILEGPWRRWREVMVHHGDLGTGFTWTKWPWDYVASELPRRRAQFLDDPANTIPSDVSAAPEVQQLAWLLGRDAGLATPPPRL